MGAVQGPVREAGTGDIKKVTSAVYTPDGSTEHLLVRLVTGNLMPAQGNTPPPDEEVLCRGCGGLTVKYYDGTEWLDDWDSTAKREHAPAGGGSDAVARSPATIGAGCARCGAADRRRRFQCPGTAGHAAVHPRLPPSVRHGRQRQPSTTGTGTGTGATGSGAK